MRADVALHETCKPIQVKPLVNPVRMPTVLSFQWMHGGTDIESVRIPLVGRIIHDVERHFHGLVVDSFQNGWWYWLQVPKANIWW